MQIKSWHQKALEGLSVKKECVERHPVVAGLRLRLYPSGRKVWQWTRMVEGRNYRKTLGRFPTIGAVEAVSMADELNELVDSGQPLEPPEPEPETPRMKVSEAWEKFMADMERRGNRPSTMAERRRSYAKYVERKMGNRFVGDIVPDDVREIIQQPITLGIGKSGGKHRSNQLIALMRTFFKFCHLNEYDGLMRNPALAIGKVKVVERRMRRTLSLREMALLVLAAREFDRRNAAAYRELRARGCGRPGFGPTEWADVVTIMVMNGNRKSEVYEVTSDEWDAKEQVWRIGGERYKTRLDVVLPVGPTTAAIFNRRGTQPGLMFPDQGTRKGGGDFNAMKAIHAIMEEFAGEPIPAWTPHAIRYGFRSNIRKSKIADSDLAEKIIHPKKEIGLVDYDVDWFDEKKEALAAWDKLVNDEISALAVKSVPRAA